VFTRIVTDGSVTISPSSKIDRVTDFLKD
jgi:hypothetical protein